MSTEEKFFPSRFSDWYSTNVRADAELVEGRKEMALALLVESINAGEINTLDGVDSPLSERIKAHHGLPDFDININWIFSSQLWTCPCCGRSKFQISRIGNQRKILAKLVIHHDHMSTALKAAFHKAFEEAGTEQAQTEGQLLVERIGHAFAASPEIMICEDCNNADTVAKKLFDEPRFFSFTIGQIRKFIRISDHSPHGIDGAAALQAWEAVKPAYKLRMKLIWDVARAAATNSHWYEPWTSRTRPIPQLGYGGRQGDALIKECVSTESLLKALGPKYSVTSANVSRWRTETKKAGRSLPSNYIAMLRSESSFARCWDAMPEGWSCPICKRSKYQTGYVGKDGRITFMVRETSKRGLWTNAPLICNHCKNTVMSIRLELSKFTQNMPRDSYSLYSPEELSSILIPIPHSHHNVRPKEAANLIDQIRRRIDS